MQSLILRGPPPAEKAPRAGLKRWMWVGLGIGLAASAVLGLLYATGRSKPAKPVATANDVLKSAEGLLMKEPLNLPQPTAIAEGP